MVWKSYKTKDESCGCHKVEEWKEGVQEFYDGVSKAFWGFRGPSYKLANNNLAALEIYVAKLIYFANSNSTVLATSATAMLEAMSKCKKYEQSGLNIIKESDKVVLEIMNDFIEVVSKLSDIIGQLTCKVNDVLHDVGCALSTFMKEFIVSSLTGFVKKVDYEPVFKQYQKLMNTIALIAETLLNKCELVTPKVEEAVTVLGLVLNWCGISVQGINSCVLDTLYEEECDVSPRVESVSMSVEYALYQVTQSVASVVFPLTDSIKALLTNIVNITMAFNKTVKDILGVFKGVTITVGQITQNLSKTVSGTVTGVTKGLTNILKGIAPK